MHMIQYKWYPQHWVEKTHAGLLGRRNLTVFRTQIQNFTEILWILQVCAIESYETCYKNLSKNNFFTFHLAK